jgi:prepilin-type N-terminal cleavage/methylation domain-containing protein
MRFPAAASATSVQSPRAFTLIELLVVIAIIAILVGLLFSGFRAVQDQAKRTQAKNDLAQIVTAVNAYYTEYGKYPVDLPAGNTTDAYFGSGTTPPGATSRGTNDWLFDVLRANTSSTKTSINTCPGTNLVTCLNPRQIVFISPPDVKVAAIPHAGIATQTVTVNGISIPIGTFVDPWGTPYNVEIDVTYDNQIANPYPDTDGSAGGNASSTPAYALGIGVIGWSYGSDQTQGSKGVSTNFKGSDDVISWQ